MIFTKKLILFITAVILIAGCSPKQNTAVITPQVEEIVVTEPLYRSNRLTQQERKVWWLADLVKDTIPGISLDKAYQYLAGRTGEQVIVAVADTGVDTDHEDLKDVLWVNEDEPVNDEDDDGNGFVDDVHGWNFLGNTYKETLEMTRMVRMFRERFGDKTLADISEEEKADFELFKKLEEEIAGKSGTYFNVDFNPRADGPDPYDWTIKVYGDNNVKNTVNSESHASHVSGIIAANRINGKGMKGVANLVKIMPLRVVPHGDEYDKDVALGIRYAVDNGAKVINASFGKGYSPKREWVYDAIKYAAEKDVLLVISAGNSGANIDSTRSYPNDTPDNLHEITDNVIMVGAHSYNFNESLPAAFSNYGKNNVDIFAPGVAIYSTVPGDSYQALSGTSMAAPVTAGVAALLRSYFPNLSAAQIKSIILKSGTSVPFEVMLPGGDPRLVPFTDLCKTGKIINAYQAVKMADALSKMVN